MDDEGILNEGMEEVAETAESGEVEEIAETVAAAEAAEAGEVEETAEAVEVVETAEAVEDAVAPDFGELNEPSKQGDAADLAMLYDLTMPVAIELGRTTMSVHEILSLGRGSVVQLDRLAGEPIDVFVGDRRFAEGEVVIVGEQFGIRITRIVQSPTSEVMT